MLRFSVTVGRDEKHFINLACLVWQDVLRNIRIEEATCWVLNQSFSAEGARDVLVINNIKKPKRAESNENQVKATEAPEA